MPPRVLALVMAAACAAPRATLSSARPVPAPAAAPPATASGTISCTGCSPAALGYELAEAIEQRVADLRARGGPCAVYGAVLER
ncbi:MAG TPA: hypothetical protein VLE53_18170, partial [Gemmatimonadaceae bacterium]|nr:hypothetical protein [Gemmatimonadaceae bacterium]